MIRALKKPLWKCWDFLAGILARSYIVGPELEDALAARRRLSVAGMSATLCYWNTEADSPPEIASAYVHAIEALDRAGAASHISIKMPALKFDRPAFQQVLEAARKTGMRLIFDSHSHADADSTLALLAEGLARHADLSLVLPGRWRRSIADADWAVTKGLTVRVVKGQWADVTKPEVPALDFREGFLAVIDRLAGRARHVAVATHDAWLAKEALSRLLKARTPCELELLYGLPMGPALAAARAAGVPVRIYLPYGHGWAPYCISQVYDNPRLLWWMIRDLVDPHSFRLPAR